MKYTKMMPIFASVFAILLFAMGHVRGQFEITFHKLPHKLSSSQYPFQPNINSPGVLQSWPTRGNGRNIMIYPGVPQSSKPIEPGMRPQGSGDLGMPPRGPGNPGMPHKEMADKLGKPNPCSRHPSSAAEPPFQGMLSQGPGDLGMPPRRPANPGMSLKEMVDNLEQLNAGPGHPSPAAESSLPGQSQPTGQFDGQPTTNEEPFGFLKDLFGLSKPESSELDRGSLENINAALDFNTAAQTGVKQCQTAPSVVFNGVAFDRGNRRPSTPIVSSGVLFETGDKHKDPGLLEKIKSFIDGVLKTATFGIMG